MAFEGFPAEALEFFEMLVDDNTKAFWSEHRQTYDEAVRAPMEALLADLAPVHGEGSIFRPYRDVRFSNDKSPYKTHIGATFEHGGYVQLSADGLAAGAGYYQMARDQLDRFRRAIDADATGAELERITGALTDSGLEVTAHSSLKTAPRGYPKDHGRIELLRLKGCIVWKQWPVEPWLGTPVARDRVADLLAAARPLLGWLDANVGPTELVDER